MKKQNERQLFQCPECKLWYAEKKWAKKCEDFCRQHNACNMEIIKHAVEKNN